MNNQNNIVVEAHVPAKNQAAKDAYQQVQNTKAKIRALQKQRREMLTDNEEYNSAKNEQLRQNREVKYIAEGLLKRPEFIRLEEQIKTLKDGLKNEQLSLFTELDKYTAETGQYVLPIDDEGKRKVVEREYKLKDF